LRITVLLSNKTKVERVAHRRKHRHEMQKII
jgi:hypothetical protein